MAAGLLGQTGKLGQHLRDNEWLMMIKQRSAIPGGVCEFDLPAYHYWLNRSADERRRDLAAWIEPFAPIAAALARNAEKTCARRGRAPASAAAAP